MPDGGAWDTGQPHEIVPLAQQPTAPVESLLDEDDFAVIREENDRSAALIPDDRQREILLANIVFARGVLFRAVERGDDPFGALDRVFGHIVAMIEGRAAMVVPPHMIDPAELEHAVALGRELAVRYGW